MNDTDEHFSLDDWADFVRGQGDAERRKAMQEHLDGGCRSCAKIVELWRSVLDKMRREKQFQVGQSDLRYAKALFAAFPPEKARGVKLRVAQLTGFTVPDPVGVRRHSASASHFLFQEGGVVLDFDLRSGGTPNSVSMVGQVFDSSAKEEPYQSKTVTLMRKRDVLSRSVTNELGEFALEYTAELHLLLVVELEEKSFLVASLPHPPSEDE